MKARITFTMGIKLEKDKKKEKRKVSLLGG
jgi:hypothetical protein